MNMGSEEGKVETVTGAFKRIKVNVVQAKSQQSLHARLGRELSALETRAEVTFARWGSCRFVGIFGRGG